MYHLGVGGYFALTNRKSYKEFHENIKGGYYMDKLAIEFEEELRSKMIEAKKTCGYNPTRFNQMLSRYGGVETARRLIANAQKRGNPAEGLSTLWAHRRLDLSMEASVCNPKYAPLFSEAEIRYCKEILKKLI